MNQIFYYILMANDKNKDIENYEMKNDFYIESKEKMDKYLYSIWNIKMNKITKKQGEKLIVTDTVTGYPIDKWQRSLELSRKLEEFSGYKLIVTDRLHGVIFSVLTQTPCIIWRGVSYKNKGIYQILSRYIALHYAENLKEFEKILENGIPVWKVIDQQGLEQQMIQGLDRFAKTLEIKKRI